MDAAIWVLDPFLAERFLLPLRLRSATAHVWTHVMISVETNFPPASAASARAHPRMCERTLIKTSYRLVNGGPGSKGSSIKYYVWTYDTSKSGIRQSTTGVVALKTYLTHRGWDKMDAISQTTFSRAFSSMNIVAFWLNFHWNMFARNWQ